MWGASPFVFSMVPQCPDDEANADWQSSNEAGLSTACNVPGRAGRWPGRVCLRKRMQHARRFGERGPARGLADSTETIGPSQRSKVKLRGVDATHLPPAARNRRHLPEGGPPAPRVRTPVCESHRPEWWPSGVDDRGISRSRCGPRGSPGPPTAAVGRDWGTVLWGDRACVSWFEVPKRGATGKTRGA